jgi:hypothetical protein
MNGGTVTGNTSMDNRIDIVNSGTFALFSGNQYHCGGQTTAPEIDGNPGCSL